MTIEIDLAGQVALVTGGARGVGRGITERLLAAGATVVVCGRTSPSAGVAARRRRRSSPPTCATPSGRPPSSPPSSTRHGRLDVASTTPAARPAPTRRPPRPASATRSSASTSRPPCTSPRRPTRVMQTQDDGGVDRQHRLAVGPAPLPRHRRLRRRQGRPAQPHHHAWPWSGRRRCGSTRCRPAWSAPSCSRTTTADPRAPPRSTATVPLGRVAEPADVGNAVAFLASPAGRLRQRRQPRGPRRRRAPRLLRPHDLNV